MKRIPIITAILTMGLTSALLAEGGQPRGEGDRRPSREEVLERFDLDKDGELSEDERKAAREARMQRRGPAGRQQEGKPHGEKRGKTPPNGERHKRHLEKFDKDKDGKLSDEERRAARDEIAKGFGQRGDKMREHMLKKFDKDGDGKLSETERQEAHREMRRHKGIMSDRMTKAKKRFMKQFDTDGDGKTSKEEKVAAKKEIERRMAELKKELILKHDSDGDGKLSEEERRSAHEQEKQEMLDRFDSDKDGELNGEEKKAAFEYMMDHQPYRLMHQMKERRGGPNGRDRGGESHLRDSKPRSSDWSWLNDPNLFIFSGGVSQQANHSHTLTERCNFGFVSIRKLGLEVRREAGAFLVVARDQCWDLAGVFAIGDKCFYSMGQRELNSL